MKIQVSREGNAYVYKVSDCSGVSESELKSMYYERDGNGYLDFGPYAQSHLEKIKWKNHTILVPPLQLHIKSNLDRGRIEVVNKIKAAI